MDATPHIIESALLLLAAFLLGCVVGYFARRAAGRPGAGAAETPLPAPAAPHSETAGDVATRDIARGRENGDRSANIPPQSKTAAGEKAAAIDAGPSPDDLRAIRGIGPRLEAALRARGIDRYAQIAGWSEEDIARLDAELSLRGRIKREKWIDQAKALLRQPE